MFEVTVILVLPTETLVRPCPLSKLCVHTITNDFDMVAELAGLALNLDSIMQVLLKVGPVEDTVTCGLRVVDNEFMLSSRGFSGGGLGLEKRGEKNRCEPTEKGTQQSGTSD